MIWKLSRFSASPAGERLGRQCRRHQGEAAAGHQHELAPVDRVHDRAAQHSHGDGRHHLRHADRADREGGVGEVVDLEHDGEGGQCTANRGQGGPGPQPAERGRLPQRSEIRQQPAPVSHDPRFPFMPSRHEPLL